MIFSANGVQIPVDFVRVSCSNEILHKLADWRCRLSVSVRSTDCVGKEKLCFRLGNFPLSSPFPPNINVVLESEICEGMTFVTGEGRVLRPVF